MVGRIENKKRKRERESKTMSRKGFKKLTKRDGGMNAVIVRLYTREATPML